MAVKLIRNRSHWGPFSLRSSTGGWSVSAHSNTILILRR